MVILIFYTITVMKGTCPFNSAGVTFVITGFDYMGWQHWSFWSYRAVDSSTRWDYRLWLYGLAALKFLVLQSSGFFDQVTICGSQVSTSICAEFHALGWNTSIPWRWVWMAATVIQVQQSQFQRSGNSVHLETILPKSVVMHLKEYKAFHTPMCRIKCSQSFVLSFSQGAPKSVNMMTISTLKYVNLRLINLRNRHQC